ncbi:glycerophosphodiester phosphodiesterase [Jeotgalibacillus marinus]|uniref:Glycerophosphodiester phosphodiesterase family protein n=1 Tax=Jeotgalibacillus marinus TaxID=86667 RepID=A0ABV3Q177_9BACL
MKIKWGKKRLMAGGLIGVCLLLLVGYMGQSIKRVDLEGMITVAHRGAANFAPENTMSSFQKGLDLGADFIEGDVHLSKDGELIVIHDESVDRTTNGKGLVKNFTLDELKKLDAGTSFHSDFEGEAIITLNELLEEFYGKIGILIEIKNPSLYPGIEEKVVEILDQYNDLQSIVVQSFSEHALKKIHELNPKLQIAVLIETSTTPISSKKLNDLTSFATYINFNISNLNKRMVDEIHQREGKVLVWSKTDPKLIQKAFRYGVDGIITDFSSWPYLPPVYVAEE